MLQQNVTGGVAAKPASSQDVVDVLNEKSQYLWEENNIKVSLGVIHSVRTQKFPKNKHFLIHETHRYVCVSGGKKC